MDIATVWDVAENRGDWQVASGSLLSDAGLKTAVLLSLGTDALAEPDDRLPDGDDRRGWWADAYDPQEDRIGSRLWLLSRELSTEQTRRRAVLYAEEALAWLVTDDIAASVTVDAEYAGDGRERLDLAVLIRRGGAGQGVPVAWSMTLRG